jgi:GT2 family glycosyltransferase
VTASSLEKKQKISFLPKRLSVLLLKHNYGFTGGNNIAINHVLNEKKAEFVLLLNNDTIVDKQSLTELIKVAWSNKKIGFVGPQIYEIADTKSAEVISSAGGKFNINTGRSGHIGNKEIENGQYDHIRAVDFIEGTSILARTQMIKDVGLLNPFYFTYWEDVEWCLRGREQGYTSVHAPAAKIWHKIGYLKKNRTSNAYYYYGRNLILLIKQHANSKQKAAFAFCFLGAEIWFNLLITLKTSRSIKVSLRYLRGILDGFLSNSEFFIDCNVESKRLDNSSKKDK